MTRRTAALSAAVVTALALAAPAQGHVAHTVAPGETLWSIAAASNLTTRTVAAFNGLSENSLIHEGQTIYVPSVEEGAAALQAAGVTPATSATASTAAPAASASASPGGYTVQVGDTLSGLAATTGVPASDIAAMNGLSLDGLLIAGTTINLPTVAPETPPSAPAPQGGYTVRPGDTLSGLAATAGVSASDIAAMNGLSLDGVLVAGTVIKLPTGAPAPPAASEPAPDPVVPAAEPVPTATRVSEGDIHAIAAEHGVPGSLAAAIAWQESGFNNSMVSSANARGVMQVMPGTWDYVENVLGAGDLDPSSATDNVRAGVIYLKQLLNQTGGDETAAAAAYYQGLGALRSRGMFEDTKQYVANVQALRSRFGG